MYMFKLKNSEIKAKQRHSREAHVQLFERPESRLEKEDMSVSPTVLPTETESEACGLQLTRLRTNTKLRNFGFVTGFYTNFGNALHL